MVNYFMVYGLYVYVWFFLSDIFFLDFGYSYKKVKQILGPQSVSVVQKRYDFVRDVIKCLQRFWFFL